MIAAQAQFRSRGWSAGIGQRVMCLLLGLVAVVCSILVGAPVAQAQVQAPAEPLPSLSLQRFRPAPGPADYLSVFGASVDLEKDQKMKLSGGFYFNFGNAPLRLTVDGSANESNVVDYQFGADMFTNFAFYKYFEVGLVLPILLAQQRDTAITNVLFSEQTIRRSPPTHCIPSRSNQAVGNCFRSTDRTADCQSDCQS